MKVGLNGTVVDAKEAVISVYDHGFLYGLGLFETFRTYKGRPYLLDRHMNRLLNGCGQLGIRYSFEYDELTGLLKELLSANNLEDGYVRLTVSAGVAGLGLPAEDYNRPNELILLKELPPLPQGDKLRGKELRLLRTQRNTPEGEIRFKSLHYMNNIIAKRELMAGTASPGAEGLMLSGEGWLAEGIVSNLFFAKEGVIHTPSIQTGILPGITRGRVMELGMEVGFEVREGLYVWEQLLEADEIWLTNSIQELVPVTQLTEPNGQSVKVGNGQAGTVTKRLLSMYRESAWAGKDGSGIGGSA